jgi:hypothetical protein
MSVPRFFSIALAGNKNTIRFASEEAFQRLLAFDPQLKQLKAEFEARSPGGNHDIVLSSVDPASGKQIQIMLEVKENAVIAQSIVHGSVRVETQADVIPATGEWLLAWFMDKARRDEVLGDIKEEFLTDKLAALGQRSAKLWYWTQIMKSIWPFLRAWLLRALTIAMLVKLFRRFGL